jgi:hypothetical protein
MRPEHLAIGTPGLTTSTLNSIEAPVVATETTETAAALPEQTTANTIDNKRPEVSWVWLLSPYCLHRTNEIHLPSHVLAFENRSSPPLPLPRCIGESLLVLASTSTPVSVTRGKIPPALLPSRRILPS